VTAKLGGEGGGKIFELFLEVFGHLPLAATIGEKVFVVHGGLSTKDDVMLDDIRKIKRGMEPPESGKRAQGSTLHFSFSARKNGAVVLSRAEIPLLMLAI